MNIQYIQREYKAFSQSNVNHFKEGVILSLKSKSVFLGEAETIAKKTRFPPEMQFIYYKSEMFASICNILFHNSFVTVT